MCHPPRLQIGMAGGAIGAVGAVKEVLGPHFGAGKVTVLRKPYGTSLWNHLDDGMKVGREVDILFTG